MVIIVITRKLKFSPFEKIFEICPKYEFFLKKIIVVIILTLAPERYHIFLNLMHLV